MKRQIVKSGSTGKVATIRNIHITVASGHRGVPQPQQPLQQS
jgi:hypothetical protein